MGTRPWNVPESLLATTTEVPTAQSAVSESAWLPQTSSSISVLGAHPLPCTLNVEPRSTASSGNFSSATDTDGPDGPDGPGVVSDVAVTAEPASAAIASTAPATATLTMVDARLEFTRWPAAVGPRSAGR